jgi:pyrimidine deaminase RibD-like protein
MSSTNKSATSSSVRWYDDLMMELAISAAKLSPPIQTAYCVGAVLLRVTPPAAAATAAAATATATAVSSSATLSPNLMGSDAKSQTNIHNHGHGHDEIIEVLTTGYSRELDGNTHAEECALLKFAASVTQLSTLSSLIPSSIRLTPSHTLTQLSSLLTPLPSSITTQLSSYYKSSTTSGLSSTLVNGLFGANVPAHSPSNGSSDGVTVTPLPLSLTFPNRQNNNNNNGSYFVLYTTMEPCSYRLSGKVSCSQLISLCGHTRDAPDVPITRIIVGVHEPDLFVHCDGVNVLHDGGITIISTSPLLQYQCSLLNQHLTRHRSSTSTSSSSISSTSTTPPTADDTDADMTTSSSSSSSAHITPPTQPIKSH